MRFMNKRTTTAVIVAASALVMGACDVTNPGPVQDDFLSDKESHEALVNGAGRRLQEAMNNISYTSALPAREIFPGGQTGAHGHAVLVQGGYFEPGSFGGHFNLAVQARFIAETALDIFAGLEGTEDEADPGVVQQAQVWAGYAHRVLGENWCEAVFDGGPAEPGIRYFERAEQFFTDAINNATDADLVLAAYAGRAQVRVWLEDWAGAAADAGMIADRDWSFDLMSVAQEEDTRNMLYYASATASPYRAYTMWYTYYGGSDDSLVGVAENPNAPPPFDGYYELTGDPRVKVLPQNPTLPYANAALSGYGQTPWLNQAKYTSGDDAFRLASGAEMRLIEAEALLNDDDPAGALAIIDALRASYTSDLGGPLGRIPDVLGAFDGYDGWTTTPTTVPEVMTHLMRERGIELWGEARRWGDLRRWEDGAGLGGDVQYEPFENVSDIFAQAQAEAAADSDPNRLRCFDIPNSEREANPNLPVVN